MMKINLKIIFLYNKMDPLNKIKFVEEDGSSVILDVPMTARGERKEALPIDKMDEIEEVKEAVEEVKEAVEEEVKEAVEEEVKVKEAVEEAVEEKVEKELQEVNALVNDIKEQGIKEVADSIEIKIKPPKGCCVIQ